MKKIILILASSFIVLSCYAQLDTTLEAITVTGQKGSITAMTPAKYSIILTSTDLKNLDIHSINDLLSYIGGLDIRKRGTDETQADISIRGGSFDQVLILINGVNITDFQTGHHSLNIPINPQVIDRIEILEGAAARMYGANSFAGVINIITKTQVNGQLSKADITLGQYSYRRGEVYGQISTDSLWAYADISRANSAGYFENTDFDISKAFLSISGITSTGQISFKSGLWLKDYGAYNFYTPLFPDQYEHIKGFLNILSHKTELNGWQLKTSLFQRSQDEIFELFREGDGWYQRTDDGFFVNPNGDTAKFIPNIYQDWNYYKSHNFHRTLLLGLQNIASKQFKNSKLLLGLEARMEQIRSNTLGYPSDSVRVPFYDSAYFTHFARRENLNFYTNYLYRLSNIEISAGLMTTASTQYGFSLLGGADISYATTKSVFYASVNQSMREPTFTELFYNGPANQGNPNLHPEKATTYETGLKYYGKIKIQSALFYRLGSNIIDWIRYQPTDKWQTANYTKLNTYGFEISATKHFKGFIKSIYISYKYLDQTKAPSDVESKYVLDYLKHYANLLITTGKNNFGANINLIYADRNGSFELYNNQTGEFVSTPYNPYLLVNLNTWYKWKIFRFYLKVDNALNTHYYDISNVALPGRWVKIGLNIELK